MATTQTPKRVVVAVLAAVLVSSSLLVDIARAVDATSTPDAATQGELDPGWRADGARVVERDAVPLAIPAEGGVPVAGTPLDPSVELRGEPAVTGWPTNAGEIEAWRTEHSKSILNPDGSITAEYSGGRLNYRDARGEWQPLDLSLLAQSAAGGYEVTVTASDRQIRFSADAIETALAELSAGAVSLKIRALDFPGVLTPPSDDASPSPDASASPSPSSEPTPTPPAVSPSPTLEPSPSAEPFVDPTASPTTSPSAASSPSKSAASASPAEPSPSPSPEPSIEPSVAPTTSPSSPTPSASPDPSAGPTSTPTPTPSPDADIPAWVLTRNELRFTADPAQGTLITHPTDTGFEFSVVIGRPDQVLTYAFAIDAGELDASLDADGRTILIESLVPGEGELDRVAVGRIGSPVLIDANNVVAPPDSVAVALYRAGDEGPPPAGVSEAAVASLGPTEVLIVYAMSKSWLANPDVQYPVTLDPTVCIQVGGAGCTSTAFETYVGSGQPTTYPNPPSMLRVGYDAIGSPDAAWAHLRSLVYFGDVALPDGAQVTSATLAMRQSDNRDGSLAPKIQARLINKPWGSNSTFNDVQTAWNNAYNSPTNSPCSSSPTADCTLNLDVEKVVRAWYTRRGQDWQPNMGFLLVHEPATVSWEETDFYMSTDGTVSNRPKLTIDYYVPAIEIDFASALGATYAPSTMVAGIPVSLPLLVDNNSTSAWGLCTTLSVTDCSTIGYRWFNAKGKVEGNPGFYSTSGTISAGQDNYAMDLVVTPPAVPGSYTLRLDYARLDGGWNGTPVFASDYAQPSKFYSRNKKALSSDNTRWTGTSVIERDEFQIGVVSGAGTNVGELRTVELADGGSLGINLYSRNLHYEGAGGVGFDDLIPLDLNYGYDSANAIADSAGTDAGCEGILDACGWYTNWDERLTAHPTIAGVYTYQGPSGNRYQVDTDGNGQLISGAPVLLERVRYTGFDEQVPANATGTSTPIAGPPAKPALVNASEGFAPFSGTSFYEALSSTPTLVSGLGQLDLNAYQSVRFAMRTTSQASSGIALQIHNASDPGTYPDRWFVYTIGTDWVSGFSQFALGGLTPVATWRTYSDNLYERIRANIAFGKPEHSYQIISLQIQGKAGFTGSAYLDALQFIGNDEDIITDSSPAWSSGTTGTSTDAVVGTHSLIVNASTGALAPSCQTSCFTSLDPVGDLYAMPFVSWYWRKVGGTSVAMEFNLKDVRTNATGQITYYAGPVPPPGAINPIQVSDTVPVNWTKVTRNVLDDGRQVLNFFNDGPTGTTPGAPPTQGPTPDEVKWIGLKPWAPDGLYALVDEVRFGSIPRRSITATLPANDYVASYADGSEHWFNPDGLLEEILDRDGNMVRLDWSNPGLTRGQDGYSLATIHAPSDSGSYNRQIDVTGPGVWTFTEGFGTAASPTAGRSTRFFTSAADVTTIRPARDPSCNGTPPSGCNEFTYAGAPMHRLAFVTDPRWDGTTIVAGPNDYRHEITWADDPDTSPATTEFPVAIVDRTHASAARLKVVDWTAGSASPAASRVLWQDAAAAAASSGIYTDLTSDGSTLYDYVPIGCGGSPCNPSMTGLVDKKTVANEFDGLARVSTQSQYSYATVTPTPLISRQGTKAAAKIDNYNDPLAAGGVAWTQSPDQHYASMVDSGGTDRDLYRTFKTYDASGNELTTTTPAYNARPDYAATTPNLTQATSSLKGYWRLGETSGTTAVDSDPTPHDGTYVGGLALGGTGALIGDPNKAPTFDGSNDGVTIPSSFGTVQGTFSVSVWAKPALTTGTLAVLGSRSGAGNTFDMKFMNGNLIHADIGSGGTWLTTSADAKFTYVANRWYHVVYAVTPSEWLVYVDGRLISRGIYNLASGNPRLTDATRLLQIGNNGVPGEHFNGQIDEVAVYDAALTAPQVQAQYQAGRSVAQHTARTMYDAEGHPIQVDDQFVANPGFESAIDDWDMSGGAQTTASQAHPPIDPSQPASVRSLQTNLTGKVVQDVALVAGQTARFQVWEKRTGASTARIQLSYWKRSSGTWDLLVDATKTSASWASHAWDVTLPFDTDGRVRIALWQAGGAGADSVYYDDVALLTSYARTTYLATGLVDYAYTFAGADGSGGPSGEIALHPLYAAAGVHPAIFATTSIANDVASPSGPDQDVTSTATYDAWGRTLTTIDPDGVDSETHYVASGDGISTDVDWTEDGLDNRTTYDHDHAGNQLSATSPTGRVTATTYDLPGHAIRTTAPDGVVSQNDYDNFGRLMVTWANYVDGTPGSGTAVDDVKTTYAYDEFGRQLSTRANDGGGLAQAKSAQTYDLLDRITSSTTYSTFDGTTFAGERVVQSRPHIANAVTRPGMSGSRGPGTSTMTGSLVPTVGPAPGCPNGADYCNVVTAKDLNGLATGTTDAYGKVSRSFNDVAGRSVIAIANYGDGVYSTAAPDTDLVSITQYDIGGRAVRAIDVLGRATQQTFDALGRSIKTATYDTAGVATTKTETVYTPAGRVDRLSRPAAYADAASAMAWTRTVYDGAGRAASTLDNYDLAGAGIVIDGFEAGIGVWSGVADGWFLSGSATLSEATTAPLTGHANLAVTTTSTYAGAAMTLPGTYLAGHTYRLLARVKIPSGGGAQPVEVLFGQSVTGSGNYASGTYGTLNVWNSVLLNWTPSANVTGARVAIRQGPTSSSYSFSVDDITVYDLASPDRNIPTTTAYDADGRVIRSILPPGVIGEPGLTTATGYDLAGRVTSVTVNKMTGAGTPADANLTTSTAYDALGRATTSTDPTGTVTRYTYDRLGRVTETILNYVNGTPSSATADDDVKSTYAYDATGAMTAYCPARNIQSADACDPLSTATTTNPYKSAWHYAYDEGGHLVKQLPPVRTSGITQLDTKLWTYDPGMRLTKACDAPAGATSCSTADRNSVPTYDGVGRVTVLNTYTGSGTTLTLRTESTYKGDGVVEQTKYSEGATPTVKDTIDYTYDSLGRPDQLKRSGTVLSDFGYNADGTIASRADGDNGVIGTSSLHLRLGRPPQDGRPA